MYPREMPPPNDPDWGRSKPRAAVLEIVVTILSLCAIVWGMIASVSYARELGRPLGFVGFLELWFREAALLALFAVALLTALCMRLWRLLRSAIREPHRTDDPPPA